MLGGGERRGCKITNQQNPKKDTSGVNINTFQKKIKKIRKCQASIVYVAYIPFDVLYSYLNNKAAIFVSLIPVSAERAESTKLAFA